MSGSCCGGSTKAVEVTVAPQRLETATETVQKCCGDKPARSEKADMRQLPIVWQRLVSAGGTCPRCDATYQHLQSAIVKLREALKPLNVEPILEVREISESSFRKESSQSNRIWIADKPIEEWIGASVGSSKCCSVCGDEPCRTMEVEGAVFEDIPESVIMKAALIAASGLIGQTA
ncbi:DUF2703 domain-containing protein [Bradyrhizobium sediminis]|uniref:DUF2703 domain-containing protein n=1 Tax=Bradyrhizobium sediminis TaxID=2840469 RepID=A0A975NFF5_9BRAD|nr:DUF2703 domain-containing protein [Bradyrhizobium sediminis]QWG14133.1 DUF2703 domain-containing protein [Bradyrhizobium sediminis]